MITAIKAENISAYKALFEEAADILSGYKRVRTYDTNKEGTDYFYKNSNATHFEDDNNPDGNMYLVPMKKNESGDMVPAISDLASFASTLEEYEVLYVKAMKLDEQGKETNVEVGVAEGYEPMMGITTLEEYFAWIKNLGGIDRKYTVLPLDEPHFEINANTRAITIPADFKKNGIAVQGDDLAEVVYFKIDRYFDYMDLNNCDIYIQWETPKGADGKTVKSVSAAYIRDIESEPGKLIFGWAISDAITGASGNLKFSVRFFQWNEPETIEIDPDTGLVVGNKVIAYSFATLTATVAIQPSINFNPETEEYGVDDCGERLVSRLENSEIVGGYAAAVPVYLVNLLESLYDLDPNTNTKELVVQANSEDTGVISYVWKRQNLSVDNKTDNEEITIMPSENKMTLVTDYDNMNKTLNYYKPNGSDSNGNPVYTMYRGTIPPSLEDREKKENIGTISEEEFDALKAEGNIFIKGLDSDYLPAGDYSASTVYYSQTFKLYTKESSCIANNYGVYWAVAENRITNSSASKESIKAYFLRPDYVEISQHPTEKGILAVGEDGIEYTLTVASSNNDGVLTYQWYRDPNYALNFGGDPEIWDADPEAGLIEGATEASYTTNAPGHYRAKVTNTRNLDSKWDYSNISRVTRPAGIPEVVELNEVERTFYESGLTAENCPTITMKDRTVVESDWYTVVWYLAQFNNDGTYFSYAITPEEDEEGVINLGHEGLVSKFNPKDYEDTVLAELGKDVEGAYYPIVTNHVNGSTASTAAPITINEMYKIVE